MRHLILSVDVVEFAISLSRASAFYGEDYLQSKEIICVTGKSVTHAPSVNTLLFQSVLFPIWYRCAMKAYLPRN
jgi:hypothetical protein